MRINHLTVFVLSMAAFGILLGIAMGILEKGSYSLFLQTVVSVSPAIPFLLAMRALYTHIKHLDEMKLKIAQDAVLLAVAVVAISALLLGLLELNDVIPPLPIVIFPIALISLWGIIQIVVSKRYA